MKVLLSSVFVPLLLLCLVIRPAEAQTLRAILTCDVVTFKSPLRKVTIIVYCTLARMELIAIAAVSFFRMMALWSPHRRMLSLKAAAAVVVFMKFYSVLGTLVMMIPRILGYQRHPLVRSMRVLTFFISTMMPVLVTLACYAVMIFAMYRNQRRRANNQFASNVHQTEATRSMLAVFVSNLLLSFPHSVFHLLEKPSFTLYVIIHIIFSTHFVVDPVVFVWFSRSFRHRVNQRVRAGVAWMMIYFCCRTSPTTISTIHSSSVTESIEQKSSVTLSTDQKPPVTMSTDQKSSVTMSSGQKSSVTMSSGQKSEVTMSSGQKSSVTVFTNQSYI
nr:uncharacterized protein LOC128698145 [Cherax quadricarinatus]